MNFYTLKLCAKFAITLLHKNGQYHVFLTFLLVVSPEIVDISKQY